MTTYIIAEPALFPVSLLGYVDPDDHYSYIGINQGPNVYRYYDSLDELITHVRERRKAVGLPEITNLSRKIQQYLYLLEESPRDLFIQDKAIIESSELDEDNKRTIIKDIHTGAKIAKALSKSAISGFLTAGSYGWVTKSEANERAEACANCPLNKEIKKNKLTKINDKLANVFTPLRSTKFDKELHDCAICGCPLTIKVHYSDDIIREVHDYKDTPPSNFPDSFIGKLDKRRHDCWMKKILLDKE